MLLHNGLYKPVKLQSAAVAVYILPVGKIVYKKHRSAQSPEYLAGAIVSRTVCTVDSHLYPVEIAVHQL